MLLTWFIGQRMRECYFLDNPRECPIKALLSRDLGSLSRIWVPIGAQEIGGQSVTQRRLCGLWFAWFHHKRNFPNASISA
jgi:hypothetical protein